MYYHINIYYILHVLVDYFISILHLTLPIFNSAYMCGVVKLWHWQRIYNLHHKQTPHTLDIARLFKSFDFLPFKYFKAIWSISRSTLSVPEKGLC